MINKSSLYLLLKFPLRQSADAVCFAALTVATKWHFGSVHFLLCRLYVRQYFPGLCLRPECIHSFRNITTSSIFTLWITHTEPLTILYMWLPTQARSSVCWGSWVFLSELCLPIIYWAAGSSALGRGGGGVFGLESQWGRVNAVAFPCGSWSIIKQVSQMSSTLAAGGLHPVHPIGEIICQSDGLLLHEVKEGRPTWSWVKFGVRAEQWGPTDNTGVGPLLFMVCELSSEGTLSSSLLGNMVLHRREAFPQLLLREAHWPCLLSPTCSWGARWGRGDKKY